MKKAQMKKIVQIALENKYGFAPALSAITILESGESFNRVYIGFAVGCEQYCFDGDYRFGKENGVYVGKGTIQHM